jgi:hypothetical protein
VRQGSAEKGVLRQGILAVPSVDLALLRSQSIELAGQLDDPAIFRAALRRMMESHAHRLLRRGRSMELRGALQAWDIPGLLIREVEAALRPAAQSRPDSALAAAAAVWTEGKLEEKLIAAYLAGFSRDSAELRDLLYRWLSGMEDPSVLQALSTRICLPLAAANPTLFRSQLRSWMESPTPSLRRFGWMALASWQEEKSSESIFAALDLLPLIFPETDPEAIQSAAAILIRLARMVPQETRGWLEDLSPKALQQGHSFFRAALHSLPPELAAVIRPPHPE